VSSIRDRLARALRRPYIITDTTLSPGRTHVDIARAALAGGAGVIQLRDKNLSAAAQTPIAREIASMTRAAGALFLVNDNVGVALDSQADGVHVGQADTPVREARDRLGPDAVIGGSATTLHEALTAQADGADYIGVGPVFPTDTKQDAGHPVGLDLIAEVRRAVNIPIVAIGGLTGGSVRAVLAAGADGAAFVSEVVRAPDMELATRAIAAAMAAAYEEYR